MAHFPTPTNMSNGLIGVFEYSNTVTSNIFGIGILIGLYTIVLVYRLSREGDIIESMTTAGFVSGIFGVILLLLSLINGKQLFVCISLIALSYLWAYYHRE